MVHLMRSITIVKLGNILKNNSVPILNVKINYYQFFILYMYVQICMTKHTYCFFQCYPRHVGVVLECSIARHSHRISYKSCGSVTWLEGKSMNLLEWCWECSIFWKGWKRGVMVILEWCLAWKSHAQCYKTCENSVWLK